MTGPGKEVPWDRAAAARWEVLDQAGWEYILPGGAGSRWLCLECEGGATAALLSAICAEVHVVTATPEAKAALLEKLGLLGITNVRPRSLDDLAEVEAAEFEGAVIHDLRGIAGRDRLQAFLQLASRIVAANGFMYVALPNSYSYTRVRGGARAGKSVPPSRFRPGQIMRLLGGARPSSVYPIISDERGRVVDMLGPGGYVSAKNPYATGERLRRLLLGPHTALLFCPAFAVLAAPRDHPRSRVERVVAEIEQRGLIRAGEARVKRMHALPAGKAVVSIGEGAGQFGSFIVVFARSELTISRRKREALLLAELARLPEDIARRIPRHCFQDEDPDAPAFVMQEFPGVTLDAPSNGLETATREAAAFLMRFHEATRRVVRVDDTVFVAMWGPMFASATARYPALESPLARLFAMIRRQVMGVELPVVWLHGDFKVENVVVDPRTYRLVGVIDWELSDPEGLPLLDLWYLLLYDADIRDKVHFFPAVAKLFPGRTLAAVDEAMCAEYIRLLQVPPGIIPALLGTLMIHHCARRILYDADNAARMRQVTELIDELLECAPAPEKTK